MNERLLSIQICLIDPDDANAALVQYFEALHDMTVVGVVAAPSKDDADVVITIADDASDIITVSAVDNDVPGVWQAKGYGGTNAAVFIAADSLISFTPSDNAVATSFNVTVLYLAGENWR